MYAMFAAAGTTDTAVRQGPAQCPYINTQFTVLP